MRPSPTAWSFDPLVLAALALLLGAYFAAIGPLRRQLRIDEPVSTRRIAYFVAGWLTVLLTLVTPLDTLGRYYLFGAHTLQLFILTTIAAPLLMLGTPEWLVGLLIPLAALRNATRGLLFPVIAALAFNIIVIVWHVGPLYEQALHDPGAHDLQMLSFLVAGVLTWWPLLTPLDRHTRMATPFQMLYLMLESLPLDIFGVAAIFALGPFYPAYVAAPRLFGLSAMTDQQVSGGLLAVPGNLIDITLLSIVFFTWINRMERAQRERERALYEQEDAAAEAALGSAPASETTRG
jgi:putative membrane protein